MSKWTVVDWEGENSCSVVPRKDITEQNYSVNQKVTVVVRRNGQAGLFKGVALCISDSKREAEKFAKDWEESNSDDGETAEEEPSNCRNDGLKRANANDLTEEQDVLRDLTNTTGNSSEMAKKPKMTKATTKKPAKASKPGKASKEKQRRKKELPNETVAKKAAQEERLMAAMAARNGHQKTPKALHDTSLPPTVPHQSPTLPVSRIPAPRPPTMLPAIAAPPGPPPPALISHLISPISTSQPPPPTQVPRHNHKSTPDTGFRTFNTSTPRTHTSFSSLLHDIHQFSEDSNDIIPTSFDESYEVDDYLSGTSLHAKHPPTSTSVHGVEELRKEVCLLKTQVELLHDELRQLKKRVKQQNINSSSSTNDTSPQQPAVETPYNGHSKIALEDVAKLYSTPREALKVLLTKLFTEEELVSCSIKGTNCNLQKGQERGALNKEYIAVINYIMKETFQSSPENVAQMIRGQQKQLRKKFSS